MIGLQCPRSLWISIHEPEKIPEISAELQSRFDQGHIVGEFAKKLFPEGIEAGRESVAENARATKELLLKRKPIFEAGFLADGLFARADILVPDKEGEWNILEVKSSTEVKEEHIPDVSFQKYCYEKSGIKVGKCFLVLINKEYVRRGALDVKQLFLTEDITEYVDQTLVDIEARINTLIKIASSKIPPEHCADPSTCPMPEECWGFLPKNSVFKLYRGGKKCLELYNSGILAIKDIPSTFKLSPNQQVQYRCEITAKPFVNRDEIRGFLSTIEYPLHFLDFETYNFPIPLFDGVSPYETIPFQFSLHIKNNETSTPVHHSFLAEAKGDPRKKFMEKLKKAIGKKGSIVAYNDIFEKGVLKRQAEVNSECKKWIESILPRFADLLVPFRNFHYYHPQQEGSASLKKVLPAMTGRTYEEMEIAGGGDASALFLSIALGNLSESEKRKIRENLERYCALDTEAMILVIDELKKLVK
jgi:hypothetical protein